MSHHDHHHHQDHDHSHDRADSLTIEEKLARLFDRWVTHNESHAQSYREWGKRAKEEGLTEIAALLDNISETSDRITEKLKNGQQLVTGPR